MPKASTFQPLPALSEDTRVYAFENGASYQLSTDVLVDSVTSLVTVPITNDVLSTINPILQNKANTTDVLAGLATKQSTSYQATGTAVPRDLTGKIRQINLHVDDFGAVANSATSQSAAINAAIAYYTSIDPTWSYGCVLNFGPGVYRIGSAIAMRPNLILQGSGIDSTTIKSIDDQVWSTTAFNVTSVANVHFRDLTFAWDTVAAASTTYMMRVSGATANAVFRNVGFVRGRGMLAIFLTNGTVNMENIRVVFGAGGVDTMAVDAPAFEVDTQATVMINGLRASYSGPSSGGGVVIKANGGKVISVSGSVLCEAVNSVLVASPSGTDDIREIAISGLQSINSVGTTVLVSPGSGRSVRSVSLTAPRINGATGNGIELSGAGTIGAVSITSPKINGASVNGIAYFNGTAAISDAQIAQCTGDAIRVGDGSKVLTGWSITGGRLGAWGSYTNNVQYGIRISNQAHNRFSVLGVDATGNAAGTVVDGSTGTNKFFLVHGYPVNVTG